MKKFLTLLAISLSLVGLAQARGGGSDEPFPLDYPIKFPWSAIEGIWQVVGSRTSSNFSFEVQSDCQGRQILKVYQIEPETNRIIAEGTGYSADNSLEVYAAMKGRGVENYFLHVGAYKDKTSTPQRKAVILKIFSFNQGEPVQYYEINRMPDSVPIRDDSETGANPCPGAAPSYFAPNFAPF